MDEVRVVRREDHSLIVANEAGDEYRLVVDSTVLADLRHIARQLSGGARINPREIQSLVRAGKSRDEIMELTGADENDIERYEEPVLAERRFLLSSAQSIPVRTSPSEPAEEHFGAVIAERLVALSAQSIKWDAWRDEEAGWMIVLDFTSHDVAHHAVWSFEHRKGILSPLTPDAVTLSKQGDVGDRLIPKLRAVDATDAKDRFDSDAFDREALDGAAQSGVSEQRSEDQASGTLSPGTEAALRAGHPSTGSIPIVDAEQEFARRREIDQRAIKTSEPEPTDMGQTADLLDALRRRRGAREDSQLDFVVEEDSDEDIEPPQPVSLRGREHSVFEAPAETAQLAEEKPQAPSSAESETVAEPRTQEPSKRGKGRASIPSWDDILFGTRSEEDPN